MAPLTPQLPILFPCFSSPEKAWDGSSNLSSDHIASLLNCLPTYHTVNPPIGLRDLARCGPCLPLCPCAPSLSVCCVCTRDPGLLDCPHTHTPAPLALPGSLLTTQGSLLPFLSITSPHLLPALHFQGLYLTCFPVYLTPPVGLKFHKGRDCFPIQLKLSMVKSTE